MAQLKVKQISDFVSAITNYNNANVGTAGVEAIKVAKAEAIKAAADANVLLKTALEGYADTAEADAKTYASNADVVLKGQMEGYADTAEADAKAYASNADVVLRGQVEGYASDADVVLKGQMESYADLAEKDAISSAKLEAERLDGIVLSSAKVYADDAEADALAAAKSYSDIQKGRIDTLLNNSSDALDTFKEIEDFIENLSTADINGLIGSISTAKSEAIKAAADANDLLESALKGYADTAEADAIAAAKLEAERLDAIVLSSAKSYADQAEIDAIAAAKVEAERLDGIVLSSAKSYADVAEQDAKDFSSDADLVILSTLRGEIADLAGVDKAEQIAAFVNGNQFSIAHPIALENNEVLVFVNGLQVHQVADGIDGFSTDGVLFEVSGLGYALEADDHIVVIGVLAA